MNYFQRLMLDQKIDNLFNFKEKIILITGSSGQIGSSFCKLFLDLGAADGYFALGVLYNNIFGKTVAFEKNNNTRIQLAKNSEMNLLEDRISIYKEANYEVIKALVDQEIIHPNQTLILCDIEGGEYNLFDKKFIDLFKTSFFIVEIHSYNKVLANKKEDFIKKVSNNFKCQIIFDGYKRYENLEELHDYGDNDRLLITSEGRAEMGQWILLSPK